MEIIGRVFEDLDGNGKPGRHEPPIPGVAIVVNPQYPINNLVTDKNGRFRLRSIFQASVSVWAVPPEGLHPTPGDDGVREARLARRERFAHVRVRPIPLTRTGGVTGRVVYDINGDGVIDADAPPARGWRVFIDSNRDFVRQRSERVTVSDRGGNWAFGGLAPGNYRIGIFGRRNWPITGPDLGILEVTLADGTVDSDGNVFGVEPRR